VALARLFLRKAFRQLWGLPRHYGREETNTLVPKKFAEVVTDFTGQVACKETRTFGKGGRSADEYIQHPKT
jgi:hypothetical protein